MLAFAEETGGAGTIPGDTTGLAGLATWQAAGLSLAAISMAAFGGLGAALGTAALIPVIYVFIRLRTHAPTARSTSDLLGANLGARVASTTGLLQLISYVILAASAAESFRLVLESCWWPLCSEVAAVLAVAGLSIQFYLALAVITRIASGCRAVPRPDRRSASH